MYWLTILVLLVASFFLGAWLGGLFEGCRHSLAPMSVFMGGVR